MPRFMSDAEMNAIESMSAMDQEDALTEMLTEDEIDGMIATQRLNGISDEFWNEDEGSGFERDLRRFHH